MDIEGKTINNKYRIIKKIVDGELSTVWIAENLNDSAKVFINLVKKDLSIRIEDVIRFRNEALEVSKLNVPGIEKILDFGECEDYHYVVREPVQGKSLLEMICEGAEFNIDEAVDIIYGICNALNHAHEANIIHKDLRPGNIIINTMRENNEQNFEITLISFGIVHILKYNLNESNKVIDMLYYSSPELSGAIKKSVDERSDLYSLGVLFYQLLAKNLPYQGESASSIIHKHVAQIPLSVIEKNPKIPPILENIVFKLLEKEPEKRYQTVQGLIQDIKKFKNGMREFEPGMHDQQIKLSYRTSLIGREEEIKILKEKFDEALTGKGSIYLIGGEAGRGKTRLAEELRNYVYEKQGIYINGKSCMGDGKIPYSPFKEALDAYLEYYNKLSEEDKIKVQQKVRSIIGGLGRVILKVNPSMEQIIGENAPLIELEPDREKDRFQMGVTQFFSALGQVHNAMVVLLDDLQWIDQASIDLLKEISSNISSQHLLIIGAYRDDEIIEGHSIEKFINYTNVNEFPLEQMFIKPFDINKMARFISGILYDSEENIMEIARFILKKGQGNPFFSIEILKQLVDEKVISRVKDKWQIDKEAFETLKVPSTIIDIILKRISELDNKEKNILSHAAVIGNKFDIQVLLSLIEDDRNDILRVIDKAVGMQLLEQNLYEKGKVFFVHDRVKEVFYRDIEDKAKRQIHLKIAQVIEDIYKDQIDKFVFDLAYHYEKAGDKENAVKCMYIAGNKSLENYANDDAVSYLLNAIKYIEETGEKGNGHWKSCMLNIGNIYATTGKTNEAIDIFKNIISNTKNGNETSQLYSMIGNAYAKHGDNENCQKYFEKSLEYYGYNIKTKRIPLFIDIFKEVLVHVIHRFYKRPYFNNSAIDETLLQVCFSMHAVTWSYAMTDVYKMIFVTLKTLNLTENKGYKGNYLSMSEMKYACMCMAIPRFGWSKEYFMRALDHAAQIDDQWGIAEIYQFMSHYYNWTGNLNEGIKCAEKSADMFKKIGDIKEFNMSLNPLLQGYYYQGDYENMFVINSQFEEIACKIKDNYTLCASKIFFLQYYREKGDYKEAERYGLECSKLSFDIKDLFNYCSISIELGIMYIERNEISKALVYLERAKELNEKSNFLKQYTVLIYQSLAEAYIMDYIKNKSKMDKVTQLKNIRKIKETCKRALKKTKDWVLHYGGALRVNARYELLNGNLKNTEELLIKSIEHCNKYNRKFEAAKSYYEYAQFLKLTLREDEAKSHFESAYQMFHKMGTLAYERKAADFLGIDYRNTDLGKGLSKEIRNYQRMSSFMALIRNISSILDMNTLLDKILVTVIEVSGAQNGILMLKNEKNGKLETLAQKITSQSINDIPDQIIQMVYEKGEAMVSTNVAEEEKYSIYKSVLINGVKSVLCLPIKSNEAIVGICYLENKLSSAVFAPEDIDILNSVLAQAAISIENAKLFKIATTDGLTGLISHRHFKFILEKEIERCKRYNKVFSLIMFDVDHFKAINDTYGHQAGDQVLSNVATAMKEVFRVADIIARYGGDEMAIILPETDEESAFICAQRLVEAIRKKEIHYEDKKIMITISAGIASYPKHAASLATLIKAADKALYRSKESGRDRATQF